jgi:DNA mismatch repair protein MutL
MRFERHATSKITKAEDLFNLHTKGFRGEALASIAAIAHVELKTKTANEELGTCIKIEGSEIISQDFVAASTGTSLAVKNLFFNIPARRNFLKSTAVETRHIIDEFQRVALAHPNIAFLLHHNGNEVYHLQSGNLRQRIVGVFGNKINEKLVPINEQTDILEIEGFMGKPEFAKRKRGEQFFFVNDRFIKSSYLNHAVVSGFDGLLEQGAHPSYFLYLKVPANTIDINIHPTKTEVKFDNEKALYAMIRATVKHSLGQYNVAPVLDFNRNSELDTPYHFNNNKKPKTPQITVDPNFNPFKEDNFSTTNSSTYKKEKNTQSWESLYNTVAVEQQEPQETLFTDNKETKTNKTFQIQRKYILSTIKSGVVLINQPLAHQRILYEEFLESITVKEANSQQLLFPVKISFSSKEIEMIYTIKSELESAGFSFDEFTKDSVTIKGIPVSVTESKITIILEELLNDIDLEVPDASFSHFDVMAKSFARTLSIKTGTKLSEKEQENLVNNLFSCKEPTVSPFGKATFKTLTLQEIDQLFNS